MLLDALSSVQSRLYDALTAVAGGVNRGRERVRWRRCRAFRGPVGSGRSGQPTVAGAVGSTVVGPAWQYCKRQGRCQGRVAVVVCGEVGRGWWERGGGRGAEVVLDVVVGADGGGR
jgi:hypothetical protein